MICPRCKTPVRETKVDEILVDKCDGCGGVWFDFAELERIVVKDRHALADILGDVGPQDHEPPREGSRLKCPRCSDELLTVHSTDHPDLQVEACLTCYGRWLDGGELGRVRDQGLLQKFKTLLRRVL